MSGTRSTIVGLAAAFGLAAPASAGTNNGLRPSDGTKVASALSAAGTGTLYLNVFAHQNPSVPAQMEELSASAYNSDPSCSPTHYAWRYGDGTGFSGATSNDVYHSWAATGDYKVTTNVQDNCGNTASSYFTQSVRAEGTIVGAFSLTVSSFNPLKIYADPTGSTDSDPTPIASYNWDWGDEYGETSYPEPSGGVTSHTYAAPGTYKVLMFAADTLFNTSKTVIHTITLGPVVEETSRAITYSGSWSLAPCTTEGCSADHKLIYTTSKSSSALLHFTGTKVDWYGNEGPGAGKARIYIDGALSTTVDLVQYVVNEPHIVYSTPTLTAKAHTLKVVRLSNRIPIDEFAVHP